MLAGNVNQRNAALLTEISHSSVYLNAISNRLAASSNRARFLGMVVGTAVSNLVDPEDRRMKFSMDDLNSVDGLWYQSLTEVADGIGAIEDLKVSQSAPPDASLQVNKRSSTSNKNNNDRMKEVQPTSQIVSIEEINDDTESELEDIPMYAKPDSDPEDEDEDATLVQRNKATAPV